MSEKHVHISTSADKGLRVCTHPTCFGTKDGCFDSNLVNTHFVIGEAECKHVCGVVYSTCVRACAGNIKPHIPFLQSSDTCFHLCLPDLSPPAQHTLKVVLYKDITFIHYC